MDQNPTSDNEQPKRNDRITRQAALWAALVALPLAVLSGIFVFAQFSPETAEAQPTPSASAARPQSTAPVTMSAAPLAERPATVCRALLAQLPASLQDLTQRPVTEGPEQNAAYGDPAITLACGVAAPAVPPTAEVWVANGVCWYPVEEPDAVLVTTVDREVPVQLRLPRAYAPPLEWTGELAKTVGSAVPPAESAPSGCTE
ncbi:MAG TPA: DUF3515 domain-containing protein [Micromonosporaceae bacterium]|nr:DUF3515 domain-containing protein [Micromonosporaceae bacterium]